MLLPPDNSLPGTALNMFVVGAVLLKGGTTHALVLTRLNGLARYVLYWERNATTSGIGEWALVEESAANVLV